MMNIRAKLQWMLVGALAAGLLALLLAATFPGQARNGYWIAPFCPSDLTTLEGGAICYEAATGKIRHRGEMEALP